MKSDERFQITRERVRRRNPRLGKAVGQPATVERRLVIMRDTLTGRTKETEFAIDTPRHIVDAWIENAIQGMKADSNG